jgi:hypothetical protein
MSREIAEQILASEWAGPKHQSLLFRNAQILALLAALDERDALREVQRWATMLVANWRNQQEYEAEHPGDGGSIGLAMSERTSWVER